MRHEVAQPNSVLVRRGDDADKFYVILKGKVQVMAGPAVLGTKASGEAFGEVRAGDRLVMPY